MRIGRILSCAVALVMVATTAHAVVTDSDIWINEFHYDNAGSDTGEFIANCADAEEDESGIQYNAY